MVQANTQLPNLTITISSLGFLFWRHNQAGANSIASNIFIAMKYFNNNIKPAISIIFPCSGAVFFNNLRTL